MIKTVVMLTGLAVFTGASVACFGLFSNGNDRPARQPCETLSGQARTDCEQARPAPPR